MTRRPPIGVVLAAGASTRMGTPKALLPLQGAPLVLVQVRALRWACARVRVVTGAHAVQIDAALPADVEVVHNPDWATTGPRESLARALDGLDEHDAVFVTPVDVPPAPPEVLQALLGAGGDAVPRWRGVDGHPILAGVGPTRAALRGGTLRDALAQATRVDVAWADGTLNLNTPEEWADWLRRR